VDTPNLAFARDHQSATLARRSEKLQQIRQGDLLERAGHARVATGSARRAVVNRCHWLAERHRAVGGDYLENVAANEDAITLLKLSMGDAFAVDEGPVRRAQVVDVYRATDELDACVSPRHHFFHEHHVEVARATDDDLSLLFQRELAPLVLAGDEAERESHSEGKRLCRKGGQFTRAATDLQAIRFELLRPTAVPSCT
jgi:hypothetical protein